MSEINRWKHDWHVKDNVSFYIVKRGYFPTISSWIGYNDNEYFTLLKINFENNKKSYPKWIINEGRIQGIEDRMQKVTSNYYYIWTKGRKNNE